ncbi:MAG: NAD(P)-dependent oxidoreductase [Pseudonocardiaceae bacterium]
MKIKSVGVVGLGATAGAVAGRLSEQGLDVTVYDRNPEKAAAAVAAGARLTRIPADAAEPADVVLLCMPDEVAVEEVLFDCGGIGETLCDGGFVVDASPTGPEFARTSAARLAQLGLIGVEVCLVGDAVRARDGELRVLAGCAPADLAVVQPVLWAFANEITHVGPVGSVATLRLMSEVLLRSQAAAVAEAIRCAEGSGLDPEPLLRRLTNGLLAPPVLA